MSPKQVKQVKSSKVRWGQVKSRWIKSNQINPKKVKARKVAKAGKGW